MWLYANTFVPIEKFSVHMAFLQNIRCSLLKISFLAVTIQIFSQCGLTAKNVLLEQLKIEHVHKLKIQVLEGDFIVTGHSN